MVVVNDRSGLNFNLPFLMISTEGKKGPTLPNHPLYDHEIHYVRMTPHINIFFDSLPILRMLVKTSNNDSLYVRLHLLQDHRTDDLEVKDQPQISFHLRNFLYNIYFSLKLLIDDGDVPVMRQIVAFINFEETYPY